MCLGHFCCLLLPVKFAFMQHASVLGTSVCLCARSNASTPQENECSPCQATTPRHMAKCVQWHNAARGMARALSRPRCCCPKLPEVTSTAVVPCALHRKTSHHYYLSMVCLSFSKLSLLSHVHPTLLRVPVPSCLLGLKRFCLGVNNALVGEITGSHVVALCLNENAQRNLYIINNDVERVRRAVKAPVQALLLLLRHATAARCLPPYHHPLSRSKNKNAKRCAKMYKKEGTVEGGGGLVQ